MSERKVFSVSEVASLMVTDQMDSVIANVRRARQSNHRLLMFLRLAREKKAPELNREKVAAYARGERDAFMFVARDNKARAEQVAARSESEDTHPRSGEPHQTQEVDSE